MFFQKADVTIRYKDTNKELKYTGVMLLKKEPDYLILCKNPDEFAKLCISDYLLSQKNGNGFYDNIIRYLRQTLEYYVEDSESIRNTTIKNFLSHNTVIFNSSDILYRVDSDSITTIEQLKLT